MATTSGSSEFICDPSPSDGVTNVVFANSSDLLLVSSWDRVIRLYDCSKNQLRAKHEQKSPVLDCAFSDDDQKCFAGAVDKSVTMIDLKTGQSTLLGSHDKAVKAITVCKPLNLVISGSWDGSVNVWDPRTKAPTATYVDKEKLKVYSMDSVAYRLVVAYSQRQVLIFDVRKMESPEQIRESSLMNQTRVIRCSPDGEGYSIGSIEGRVGIEYFDPSPKVQKKKYAFKCHRKVIGKQQTLYPVNSIAYHTGYGTFATGGCDGVVNVWDGNSKKRICQYPAYPTSIAALSFNNSGNMLAIAVSYTFEEGEKDHPPDAVYVKTINDHEVRPKPVPTK